MCHKFFWPTFTSLSLSLSLSLFLSLSLSLSHTLSFFLSFSFFLSPSFSFLPSFFLSISIHELLCLRPSLSPYHPSIYLSVYLWWAIYIINNCWSCTREHAAQTSIYIFSYLMIGGDKVPHQSQNLHHNMLSNRNDVRAGHLHECMHGRGWWVYRKGEMWRTKKKCGNRHGYRSLTCPICFFSSYQNSHTRKKKKNIISLSFFIDTPIIGRHKNKYAFRKYIVKVLRSEL